MAKTENGSGTPYKSKRATGVFSRNQSLKVLLIFLLCLSIYNLVAIILLRHKAASLEKDLSSGMPGNGHSSDYIALALGVTISIIAIIILLAYYFRQQKLSLTQPFTGYDLVISGNQELKVINDWSEIEEQTTRLMQEKGYDQTARGSISDLIDFLEASLVAAQYQQVQLLLTYRNKIVHQSYKLLPGEGEKLDRASNNILNTLDIITSDKL